MKAILFANTEWYLYNFRLPLAKALAARGVEVVFISPPGEYGKRLRAAGFRWESLPMDRRSLNPVTEAKLLLHIARFYKREQPDIVHQFTIKCVVYGSLAAALASVPARVNAVAGMGYVFSNSSLKARVLRPLVRKLMSWAINNSKSRLILQNPDDVCAFEQAGIADNKHFHLIKSSGVDTQRFRPTDGTLFCGSTTRVLLAARLLWDKGIAEYVEAARILRAAGLPIEFMLAGRPDQGNPRSVSQGDLDAWAIEGVIKPVGHIDDMCAQFAETDIVVLPSYYGEGVPRSLIEAAACGIPIVTTDNQGCREVVTDKQDGLIVPVRDAEALAMAIRRLHDNPEWARKLGQAARAKALAEFDESIVIERTLAVYQELLPHGRFGSDVVSEKHCLP